MFPIKFPPVDTSLVASKAEAFVQFATSKLQILTCFWVLLMVRSIYKYCMYVSYKPQIFTKLLGWWIENGIKKEHYKKYK